MDATAFRDEKMILLDLISRVCLYLSITLSRIFPYLPLTRFGIWIGFVLVMIVFGLFIDWRVKPPSLGGGYTRLCG